MTQTTARPESKQLDKLQWNMVQVAQTVPLFKALSEDEWVEIAPFLHGHCYPKDAYLFFQGDPPDSLYIIWMGRVKLVRHTDHGRDVVMEVLGPGQLIGEMAVFDGRPYSMTAMTLEEVAVVTISRRDFFMMLERYPKVALGVIAELSRRLRLSSELVRSLAVDRVEQRIARTLLRLSNLAGTPYQDEEGAVLIDMPLTRQDIAEMTGTTVETAIRVMSRFRKQGLISSVRGRVVILDASALAGVARKV
ncbi:MAG: Crp/Fnr family transcriptional regulator [Caldilineae bacterium]|nr:MAG: Crp/Fnr family transcriptional regulator [Caldilineae bacterium]